MPSLPGHIRHLQLARARGLKLLKSSWTKVPRCMEAPRRLEAPRLKVPRLPSPSHLLSILKSSPQCSLRALLFFTPELCTRPSKGWATYFKNNCRLPNALGSTTSRLLRICRLLLRSLLTALSFSIWRSYNASCLQLSPSCIQCTRIMRARATSLSSGSLRSRTSSSETLRTF